MRQAPARVPSQLVWKVRSSRMGPFYYLVHGRDWYEVVRQPGRTLWYLFKNRYLWFGIALSKQEGMARAEQEMREQNLRTRNTIRFYKKTLALIPTTHYNASTRAAMGRAALEYLSGKKSPRTKRSRMKEPVMATAVAKAPAKPVAKKPVSVAAPAKKPAAPAAAPAPAPAPEPVEPKAPKRSPVSATDEEVQAAVAGTLEPRETPTEEQITAASGRPIGKTTGLPIALGWCLMFQENEKREAAEKWTDDQISAWMKEEYPGRETKAFDQPGGCRLLYNSGRFTKGLAPTVKSVRYDENGAPIVRGSKAAPAAEEPAAAAPAPVAKPVAKKVVKA